MESTRIIQQGEIAKFKIEIDSFDMLANDFKLELIYGYSRNIVEIKKSDMVDSGGTYYFSFDTGEMVGRVIARCTWYLEDTDVEGSEREKVEEQYLCFVVTTPCPQFLTCPACDTTNQLVIYTRTEQSSIADRYQRLVDVYGRPIKTVDSEYIYVAKPES